MKSKWKNNAMAGRTKGLRHMAGIATLAVLIASCHPGKTSHETRITTGSADLCTTTPVRKALEVRTETVGSIVYDPRRVTTIPVRFGGRIEKMYVHYHLEPVRKGQKIMEIYSPEIVTAQRELLYLLESDPGNASLIGASRQKLRLLGLTDEQINRLTETGEESYSLAIYSPYRGYLYEASALAPAKSASAQADPGQAASGAQVALSIREGMYVSRGQTVFKVVNTDRVWAEFTIYPHAASYIEKGDSLVISPDFDPEWKVGAAVDFLQPFFQEGERFSKARVHLGNTKGRFLPGQLVTAHFQNRTDSVWWIPSVSVLDLGERKVVFRKENEVFSPVPVTTGRVSGTWTEVVSGLSATDTIACDGHYMSDSEGFIKTKQ